MEKNFNGGVWPTMITPFTNNNEVDYNALEELVEWYIQNGVSGLFAVCQSSEMFYLSLDEKLSVAKFIVKTTNGRVPVIASGHTSDDFFKQAEEINAMSKTGVDAVILITNRLAKQEESDEVWLENLKNLIDKIEVEIPLGFYECPYPYKRVISNKNLKWCVDSEKFYFLKDTCCDIDKIKEKLKIVEGTKLKLYNANTSTLLESLLNGAAGYSGVMANFHPMLYVWLCKNYKDTKSQSLSDILTICSLIEKQLYPVNAKYSLLLQDISITTTSRVQDNTLMTTTFKKEVEMLNRISQNLVNQYLL